MSGDWQVATAKLAMTMLELLALGALTYGISLDNVPAAWMVGGVLGVAVVELHPVADR